MSTLMQQAVTKELSLRTLITLLRIASKPDCQTVRYLGPPPQAVGLFITEPFAISPHALREPENIGLNELIGASVVVVEKIAEWHEARVKADRERDEAIDRSRFLYSTLKNYGIDPGAPAYTPPTFYVKLSDGTFTEADPQP